MTAIANGPILAVAPYNTPNSNNNFVPVGLGQDWEIFYLPIAASVAVGAGAALCTEVSGGVTTGNLNLMPTVTSKGQNFKGINLYPIQTSDSDYAIAGKLRAVAVPRTPFAKAQFREISGALTLALVNSTVAFGSDSESLNVGALGQGAVITDYISATQGYCNFNIANTTTSA